METSIPPSRILKIVEIPFVAAPTILLFLGCCIVEISVLYSLNAGLISPLLATVINTVAIFGVFTPMHDASHGSIAKRNYSVLNEVVGHLAGICFPLPFSAFKYLHLMHHKHTNGEDDPDMWAGSGPWFLLPLRWFTIEWKYYGVYLPNIHRRPLKEALVAVAELLAFVSLVVWLFHHGYGRVALHGWILPGRLAIGLLAFSFDYLPHRPHKITKDENAFEATSVTSLSGNWTAPLTWPLLYQNYHNIHHLAPYIPFYLYSTVWHELKPELIAKGTRIKPIF